MPRSKTKNMASYNYYLKDGKSKTQTPIYLLFDDGVNRCKLYIQQSINPKDWNGKTGEARKSLQGFSDFNGKLNKIQNECRNIHTSLTGEGAFTVETLKESFKTFLDKLNNRIKGDSSDEKTYSNLTNFAEWFINNVHTTAKGKVKTKGTKIQNRQTLNVLKEYETATRKAITFDRVNLDFYHDFIEYLTKVKQLNPNTIGRHIKTLKLFLNEATERGKNTKFDYKSKRFVALSEPVETIYLTEDELQRIYEFDFSQNKRLEHVRDLFIIGCFTGLRFSDFSQLKTDNIHNGKITVKPQKTGDKVVIPVHRIVKEILEKYSGTAKGLPRPISNQKMNKYLKEMGEIVGINNPIISKKIKGGLKVENTVPKYKLIATHTARRSFATNLYLSEFPAISIMKITGHKTEKSFMSYLRISEEENANQLQKHWSKNAKLKVV